MDGFRTGIPHLALSFLLIPLGWGLVGGMPGMRSVLEPFRFSLSTPQGIDPWFIFMLTINGLVGIIAQPHVLAAVGTGRTEHACRVGFLYGTYTVLAISAGPSRRSSPDIPGSAAITGMNSSVM